MLLQEQPWVVCPDSKTITIPGCGIGVREYNLQDSSMLGYSRIWDHETSFVDHVGVKDSALREYQG